MPDINGRVLADRMGALFPDLRVLFMSGYSDEAVFRHGMLRPNTAFIEKPFSEGCAGRQGPRRARRAADYAALSSGARWRRGSAAPRDLARALGEQERQLAGRAERVGDAVAVVERLGGPDLPAHLGDQDGAVGSVAGVDRGQLEEGQRVVVARVADRDGGARVEAGGLARSEDVGEDFGGSHVGHSRPEATPLHRANGAGWAA